MERPAFDALKVFLDTSALIAGVASSKGAARAVLGLAEMGLIKMFVSRQVIIEADRTVGAKLPELIKEYRTFIKTLAPVLLEDPNAADVKRFSGMINAADAPILTAAVLSGADYLITWDKRHFMSTKIKTGSNLKIVTPGEFLHAFREFIANLNSVSG